MENKIKQLNTLIEKSGIPPETYAIEECSEFIKTLTKNIRGKGVNQHIFEEGCGVILMSYMTLLSIGVKRKDIEKQIDYKLARGIKNFMEGDT